MTAYLYSVDSNIANGIIPTTLPEGEHTINYRATDAAGNWDSCSFTLDVKGLFHEFFRVELPQFGTLMFALYRVELQPQSHHSPDHQPAPFHGP